MKVSPRSEFRQKSPLIINSSKLKGQISQVSTKQTSNKKIIPNIPINISDHTETQIHKRLLSFSDDPERSPSANPPNIPTNMADLNHFKQKP